MCVCNSERMQVCQNDNSWCLCEGCISICYTVIFFSVDLKSFKIAREKRGVVVRLTGLREQIFSNAMKQTIVQYLK